ncbi:MAG: ABC transporter permease [Anaerolineales bacterium]|nr:ABC transporter permease [Anaerolineales bacterium]
MKVSSRGGLVPDILRIARKTLVEYWREPQLLSFLLAGPPFLVLLWYVIFLPAKDRLGDFLKIQVVNRDSGLEGAGLVDMLRAVEFEGKPALDVKSIGGEADGLISLREAKAALLLIIPEDFSAALEAARTGGATTPATEIVYIGDPSSYNYVFAKGFVEPYVRAYIQTQSGKTPLIYGRFTFLPGTGTSSDFDAAVPGLLVFSLLFLIISSASSLVQEEMHRTLSRFRLARVKAFALVAGIGLAQLALALVEVAAGFLAAVALGYGQGTDWLQPARILMLCGTALLFALPVIGLGLITAAFSRNDGDAASLGSILLVPLVFLSGILFPMPAVPLFAVGGRTVGLYDLFPSTLASEAIRKAVTLGDPAALVFPVVGMLLQSAVILWIGAALYQRRKLRV